MVAKCAQKLLTKLQKKTNQSNIIIQHKQRR
ncbi:phosphoribosyl-ATP diphosphatase [Escherichia phage IMM-001]|nr:phosphoribosyl-ATP diphosphatase [Escherichia phage IMM-001]